MTTTLGLRRGGTRLLLVGAISALAILGAACSDDEPAEDDATTTVTATATTTEEATATETATEEATGTATEEATGEATGTATDGTPAAGSEGEDESVHVVYECLDGLTFEAEVAQVPATWAIITLDGETIEMEQTISGSGIRYQGGDGYEYRSKGNEATLLQNDEEIRSACLAAE